MMQLFKVMVGRHLDMPFYYDRKEDAKVERAQHKGAVIMRGPDHWRGESFNVARNTRKTRRTW